MTLARVYTLATTAVTATTPCTSFELACLICSCSGCVLYSEVHSQLGARVLYIEAKLGISHAEKILLVHSSW